MQEIAQPVKIITKHRGNVENMEYGYFTRYMPIDFRTCERVYGCDPGHNNFCIAKGEFADCEKCDGFLESGCVKTRLMYKTYVDMLVERLIASGTRYVEDDGEMIIDATGHEPQGCDEHPESGCLECYGGCMNTHKEE